MSNTENKFKRKLTGVVVNSTLNKTVMVEVERRFKHPKYSKFIHRSKKYHVHDEKNIANTGEKVTIIESRPFSKMKRWELLQISK
jgi:small subunit ribosomal protein S17